jgi:CO dehydrogenase/acetyl-CoA synthase alpha subunit
MFITVPKLVNESVSNKLGELPTDLGSSVHMQLPLHEIVTSHCCTCVTASNQRHEYPTRELVWAIDESLLKQFATAFKKQKCMLDALTVDFTLQAYCAGIALHGLTHTFGCP